MKKTAVPRHIAEQYKGGAREFRATKRRQVRALLKAVDDLRLGCACFPDRGMLAVNEISAKAKGLAYSLSVKNWGR